MVDSDDYGDFDDEILEVATQVERGTTTSFLPSPRPQKRRRLHHDQHDDIEDDGSDVPPRRAAKKGAHQRTVISDDDEASNPAPRATKYRTFKQINTAGSSHRSSGEEEEAFNPPPAVTSLTPQRRRGRRQGRSSTDLELGQSTSATSISSTGKSRKGRKAKGKENGASDEDSGSPVQKQSKKPKRKTHISSTSIELIDAYCTQPPGLSSSPERLRGPIWQRRLTPPAGSTDAIGLSIGKSKSLANSTGRGCPPQQPPPTLSQSFESFDEDCSLPVGEDSLATFDRNGEVPALPTNTDSIAFDAAHELADLPSDAFASSSSSPQKQPDDVIFLSSQVSQARRSHIVAPQTGLRQTTLFGRDGIQPLPASQVNKRLNFSASQKIEPPTHHKLDADAMKTWVYPTNLGTIRDYQFNIVARGLFHNLLVALPTGLGKTFIAATIMLNWFRWTKEAQIVFVAPTKPLVSQQVEACFGIAGIPRSQTSMLTGGISPGLRAEDWANKRVFFMTPQTILNDLKTGICDPKKIVLLVVDEAHRATGAYAYVEVVKFIRRFNESFRVLALTATPGSDVESVQKVIDGLDISRVEIRTEQSLDIRNYVHSRKIEKHVFENSEEMEMSMELYSKAVQPVLNKLTGMNAYWSRDPISLTPYGCTKARAQWMSSDAGRRAHFGVKGMVNSIFTILASLAHSMELLKYHGIGPFYQGLLNFRNSLDENGKSKYKKEISQSEHFQKLMVRLHAWVNNDHFIGHPKLDFLQEVILSHFVNYSEGRGPEGQPPSNTRIMIFAHFRDSAEEIVRVLKRNEPMIRPHVFVGQAASKNSEGMDQKRQLEIIEKFRTGVYNTLVATSIGEEGLDIGEVDLIICYDSKASPIRMLQRMGRTGRKRAGKIILLQMKGKEEDDATKAKDSYEKMQEMIANGSRFTFHDDRSRRIIPKEIQPVVDKRHIEIPLENSQLELPEPRRKGRRAPKRPPKKFHMPDGVRTGFVTASRMNDDDAEEEAPRPRATKKPAPKSPGEEPVILEPLETVLLSTAEAKDLERRFQTVIDDDDIPTIDNLDFAAHPARQLILSRTEAFPHSGRLTTSIVKMLRRMHRTDAARIEELKRSLRLSDLSSTTGPDIIASDASDADAAPPPSPPPARKQPKPKPKPCAKPRQTTTTPARPRGRPRANASFRVFDPVEEAASSSPPPTDPRMRVLSQAITLGSDTEGTEPDKDEEELDSELVDFIADDEEALAVVSSSLPGLETLDGSLRAGVGVGVGIGTGRGRGDGGGGGGGAVREKAFYVPQRLWSSDEEDEELPDVSTLVGKRVEVHEILDDDEEEGEEEEEPAVRPRKRVRRVVEEDEGESE
ncbi:P-loop containing nucleoside triphosphate hydrolase protein [Cenococcum geophilum 1.58]|uniref:P-loop containing nucleoside triphosphate hydrolase protein n=1 Tax=Cenococcum geophilum 1.58 TaxID=794803 RepID=A0ACC8EMY2_9PEZI|nr:P-loop containing nucleoside triphosphate hydrolase protein [Cenococcum geophilum 1.58]